MDLADNEDSAMDDLDALTNFGDMNGLDGVDGMDGMDDLFLDTGPAIPMPNAVPLKGVPQRLEELRMNGCCQKVAWSKMGCIAYVTSDRLGVKIQAFTPSFHSESLVLNTSLIHEATEIMHICWDRLGSNLAVVDILGRISVFKTIICLNRMMMTGKFVPHPSEPFNTVVGMDWTVPMTRSNTKICYSATRTDDSWSYAPMNDPSKGPSHPIPSSHSLLVVTRGGTFRLIYAMVYQELDNGYAEVNTSLMTNPSTDNLLTHASFAAAQDDTMLLATYDVSQTVRLYRIAIEWNYPFAATQRPPPTFKLAPAVKIIRLHVLQGCAPNANLDMSNCPRLTHFHLLPALEDTISNISMKREIFAVFTLNDSVSQVWRWELQESREELLLSFQQLAIKKHKLNLSVQEPIYSVIRRKDIDLPYALISVIPLRLNTILACCRSDGVIEFRDRSSLSLVHTSSESDTIYSLVGAGFSFPQGDPCLDIALSPSACIAVTKGFNNGENNEITLKYIEQQPEHSSLTAQAFALTFGTTCLQSHNNDDLVEVIRQHHQKHPINTQKLLSEMYIAVHASESIVATDHRQLMGNQFLFRCFGMQLDLGMLDRGQDTSSDVAWMLLNIRLCVMTLHMAWESAKRDDYRPELPASVLGLVNWYIDIMNYLVGDLMRLHGKVGDPEAFQQHVSSPKNLAVRLMLSTVCRVMLRSTNRYLRFVDDLSKMVVNHPARVVQSWRSLVLTVTSSPVDVFKFDQMLAELDHYVKGNYETAGASEQDRMAIERSLLLDDKLPPVLMPVAERLATTTLSKLMEEMRDPSKVLFADTSWLWTTKDSKGAGRTIDVLRKVPLTEAKALRRCTRCECYMEHLEPRSCPVTWILQMQKQCPCGNPWIIVLEP